MATPDSWAKFTEDNIRRSASERAQSDEYLNMADNLLKETATDMWNQYNLVNESFEQRLHETNEAKEKIQNHLSAVIFIPCLKSLIWILSVFCCCSFQIKGDSRDIRFRKRC